MRIRPWHMLIFISILTLVAVWIDLPGTTGNVFGLKDNVDVHQGLDLQGGLQVLLQANPPGGGKVDSGALEGTRDTIERRVNGLGVSEPVIQTQNNNQIIVELPGVKDPEEAVRVLKETALLEIIDPQGQFLPEGTEVNTTLGNATEAEAGATPEASPGASPVGSPEASPQASPVASPAASASATPAGPVYTTIISGKDLKDAYITRTNLGAPAVGFEVKSAGASKLYDFTSANIGSYMSIALDKKIISSATIQGAISNQGEITGMSAQEVSNLVVQLKAGALSVPLEVKSSRTVGPQLGQDSIDHSLIAGIIGLGTVALFMILYYRVPGALAVLALMIYTALTFALFKIIPVTMTLAGIAGFILSIGMAVDANVLIFARMKDEIRLGRSLNNAVEAGFDHAWPSIRDSNISTMITSAILYWFGRYTGASIITGFALTLFVGVSVSMFTAITVTRTFLRLLISAGWANHPRWFGVEDPRELAAGAATAD